MNYNPWPCGKLPESWQRPEIKAVSRRYPGFIDDPRHCINLFEVKCAEYCGCKYAVAVDSCTNAIFLCLKYLRRHFELFNKIDNITIPKHTYISVPQAIIHSGYNVKFRDDQWTGFYQLSPLPIYDCAVRFKSNMYIQDSFCCLSFQIKKILPIGKGGMILTDDRNAYDWFIKARYEGRDIAKKYDEDIIDFIGWNMYMTPEDAARGVLLFDQLGSDNLDMCDWRNYPDLTKQKVFNV